MTDLLARASGAAGTDMEGTKHADADGRGAIWAGINYCLEGL